MKLFKTLDLTAAPYLLAILGVCSFVHAGAPMLASAQSSEGGGGSTGPNAAGFIRSVQESMRMSREQAGTVGSKLERAYGLENGKYYQQGNAGSQDPAKRFAHYKENPWITNPYDYFSDQLIEKDFELIMPDKKVFGCIDMRFRGFVTIFGYTIYFFQHYYPDVTTETNNFGVGVYASLLRDTMKSNIDDVMIPMVKSVKGLPAEEDMFPEGLRDDPHLGNSHTEETGFTGFQTRNMEAHTYRAYSQRSFDDVYEEVCDCLNDKYQNTSSTWINFSELFYTVFWRIPELSLLVQANEMMGGLSSGNMGASFFGSSEMHHSLGELYPLVGNTMISSERVAPLLGSRRFLGWTTSSISMQETPELDDGKDYYQRMYPEKAHCMKLSEADELNTERFSKTLKLKAFDDEAMGEERYFHWKEFFCATQDPEGCFALMVFNQGRSG